LENRTEAISSPRVYFQVELTIHGMTVQDSKLNEPIINFRLCAYEIAFRTARLCDRMGCEPRSVL